MTGSSWKRGTALPDVTREFLDSLLGAVHRAMDAALSDAGIAPASGVVDPLSVFEMATDAVFATGYDGSVTTLPFTADISEAGGGGGFSGTDIVTD